MPETATIKKPAVRKTSIKKPGAEPKTAKSGASKFSHAVFTTGGKQYRVKAGDTLNIEKLEGNHKAGDTLTFNQVLLQDSGVGEISLGTPYLEDASVTATLMKIARYKTVDVIHYKQKSRYFKKYGHRQPYFQIRIESII